MHDDFDAPVAGLDRFRRDDWPPVVAQPSRPTTSWSASACSSSLLTLTAAVLRWRGTLFEQRWLLWVFVFAVIGPVLANELGWVAAEVGRQPWIVHRPWLRTEDGDLVGRPTAWSSTTSRSAAHRRRGQPVVTAAGPRLDAMFGLIYLLSRRVGLRAGPQDPARPDAADTAEPAPRRGGAVDGRRRGSLDR